MSSSDPEWVRVGRHPVALALAPHVRAPAQELLDVALVAIGVLPGPRAQDRREAQMLAEPDHGLARGEAVAKAGCLEEAVVDPTPEAQKVLELDRDAQPEPPQRSEDEPEPDRREDR